MKGFKEFILRGNLIELAVAFIIGGAFATVVESFTQIVIELLAKAGGAPNFDEWQPGGLVSVGPFLTALVAFLLLAAIVYFGIVKPYTAVVERMKKNDEAEEVVATEVEVLTEIRDLLATRQNPTA
ncbi:MscL family protein [Propionibacteriaceae bacterium Y1923]|uniref:MscL family protein n=1 Tax=Aestuariimicrobium sp. Y1814 TaxID=3418742 RepID=UPI003C265F20